MRLADDERARVPFALIGVLLLVSTVAIATVRFDDRQVNRNAALAGDRAETALETALRDAVRDAGARAAASPVVAPANTSYGRLLDASRPYRSYVELLVAMELHQRLAGTDQRVVDAGATIDVDPIEDVASARSAMAAVEIESAGRGVVEATVRDVPIELHRDGATVGHRERTISINVTTPTLTLHERTAAFEERLNEDSLASGTLNRGLTGTLWALAWARGYGQYRGFGFENVVGDDHVELATNLAVLDAQRSVFGQSDERATGRLAQRTEDVAEAEFQGLTMAGLEAAGLPSSASAAIGAGSVDSPEPQRQTIGVNETADLALADVVASETGTDGAFVSGDASDPWQRGYRALARSAASIESRLLTSRDAGEWTTNVSAPPGSNWTRAGVASRGDPTAISVAEGDVDLPTVPEGWSIDREAERTVVVERSIDVRYWNRSTQAMAIVDGRQRKIVDVGLRLVHRPLQRDWIPSSPTAADGPRYERLLDDAEAAMLGERDGVRGVAETVATDGTVSNRTTVTPDDAEAIANAAYGDAADLREVLRGVSTTAPVSHALTQTSPAAELEATIEDRPGRYRDVPSTYDGLRDRAVVTLRNFYVDRVLDRLAARSDGADVTRDEVADEVGSQSTLPGVDLGDFLDIGLDYARPDPQSIETREPAPPLDLTVDADPSYLSPTETTDTRVTPMDDPYHPMSSRILTISSLPTEDIASKITGAISGVFESESKQKLPLTAAARTLQSAKQVNRSRAREAEMVQDRQKLDGSVSRKLGRLERKVAQTLAAHTSLGSSEATAVVEEALDDFETTAKTVRAFGEGTASARIADVARDRESVSAVDADRARTMIRDRVDQLLADDRNQVEMNKVESVSEPTRAVIGDAVQGAVDAVDQGLSRSIRQKILSKTKFSVLPSRGFPLLPYPTGWAVTANVWDVNVQGTYSSFAVRAEQGGPSGGSHVSYVRDGGNVSVDVDGDGSADVLGSSDRIAFEGGTTIAVAVPKGGGGVGNNGSGFRSATDGWNDGNHPSEECLQGDSVMYQDVTVRCRTP